MVILHLQLFHGFQADFGNGLVTNFPTNKVRALLAYLALESPQLHQRTQLATLFWGDWQQQQAKANLRKSLFRLREVLNQGSAGFGDSLLEIDHTTVQLRPELISLDVAAFQKLLKQVETHTHPVLATCSLCLERLSLAAALYGGDLLAGLEIDDAPQFESWLTYQREHLHEQALAALGNLTEARLQRHDYELAQRLAYQQIQLEPWHEKAHRQLMHALMGQGRREEAIVQFGRCRDILGQELAVSPAAETKQLLKSIQENIWDEPAAPIGQPPAGPWLHNFPPQTTPFIGRDDDIHLIQERLGDSACQLLTLLGPGGIGKTRLAIQVANHFENGRALFPAGCYFISLVTVTTPDRLISAIGEQIGLTFRGGTAPEQQLLAALDNKAILLILDNYEQLLPHIEFIEHILIAAPQITFLITSRVPLNLRAEWRLPLAGLTVPDPTIPLEQVVTHTALQLFESAARRIEPNFQLNNENAAIISTICRQLAGMPLALEIAASWLKIYSLATLAGRIEAGVTFLTANTRDMPERHRSLRVVFDQSWQLLTPDERTTFARLTCFQSHFTLEAALEIADLSLAALTTLLEHTLVQRLQDDRYNLHPVLQHFAHDCLENGEELSERHAAWYLQQVAKTGSQFATSKASAAVAHISKDLDNIRQAWQWAVAHQRLGLLESSLDGLLNFYLFRGLYNEGRDYFGAAIDKLDSRPEHKPLLNRLRLAQANCHRKIGDTETATQLVKQVMAEAEPSTYTAAVIALGQTYELRGDNSQAIAYLEEAQQLLAARGNSAELAEVLDLIGRVHRSWNRISDGIVALSQSLAINRALGNETRVAENHANLGLLYKDLGNFSEAIYHIGQAIDLSQKMDHRENVARFTQNLGLVYWQMGELEKALLCYQKGLVMAEEIESKRGIAMCTGGIGIIMRLMYRYDEALAHYRRSLQLSEASDDKSAQAVTLGNIGNVYMDQGKHETAMIFLERATALDRVIGSINGVCRHLGNMGDMFKERGHYSEALAYFEETIPQLRQIKDKYYLCWQLISYGEVLFALSRLDEAQAANEEGGQIAAEIGRRSYDFLSRLLAARLRAAQGTPAGALSQLADLQAQFSQPEEQAEIIFARWQMTGQAADQQVALELFQKLVDKTRLFRYKQRLIALRKASNHLQPNPPIGRFSDEDHLR